MIDISSGSKVGNRETLLGVLDAVPDCFAIC
jgi:hypothetical protein